MEITVIVIEELQLDFVFYAVKSKKSFDAWLLANGYKVENDKIMCDGELTDFIFSTHNIFV
jgi:hypothetical protein